MRPSTQPPLWKCPGGTRKWPIHHFHIDLVYPPPPKFCITIVFDFSCNTQGKLETTVIRHVQIALGTFYISSTIEHFLDFWAKFEHFFAFWATFFTIFHMFNAVFCLRNVFSRPSNSIIIIWIIPPCRLTVIMEMHNCPFNRGNSRFWKKQKKQQQQQQKTKTKHINVSLLFWSPIRKSRIKALIYLRIPYLF